MLVVAAMMYAVSTSHENDCLRRSKHVFSAYRAVTICRSLNTAMRISDGNMNADAAGLFTLSASCYCQRGMIASYLAMEKVFAEALPNPADPTIVTMIYTFLGVVVP